jgi:hypothetical protein
VKSWIIVYLPRYTDTLTTFLSRRQASTRYSTVPTYLDVPSRPRTRQLETQGSRSGVNLDFNLTLPAPQRQTDHQGQENFFRPLVVIAVVTRLSSFNLRFISFWLYYNRTNARYIENAVQQPQ